MRRVLAASRCGLASRRSQSLCRTRPCSGPAGWPCAAALSAWEVRHSPSVVLAIKLAWHNAVFKLMLLAVTCCYSFKTAGTSLHCSASL